MKQGKHAISMKEMARVTGLEPATSGVTGRRSNQLSYTRIGAEHILFFQYQPDKLMHIRLCIRPIFAIPKFFNLAQKSAGAAQLNEGIAAVNSCLKNKHNYCGKSEPNQKSIKPTLRNLHPLLYRRNRFMRVGRLFIVSDIPARQCS
jgi:hypothetical protein